MIFAMTTLDLKLMPPAPLGARAALVVVGATGLVMLIAALRFATLGAWPVLPFLAVDLAILVWAFRASARASRAYERLTLDAAGLVVSRVTAAGIARRYRFEPGFTHVELEDLSPPENRLWLASRGNKLAIGRCLSPRERREVHAVLRRALARQSSSTSSIV